MITASRRIEWDAAHRVLRHESKCATLHGHRYVAEITCAALDLDEVGRVIDFGVVKAIVGAWIDEHWDHTTLCNPKDQALLDWCWNDHREHGHRPPYVIEQGEPTAENIAVALQEKATELLADSRLRVSRVKIWETPNCSAEVAE